MKRLELITGRSVSFAACALASLILLTGVAFPQTEFPKTPGIWLSLNAEYKLTVERQEHLAQSLRRITGLNDLHFAEGGSLVMGSAPAETEGSATARRILTCSHSSGSVFMLEDHSDSPSVNFGQLDEGLQYEDSLTGLRLMVWRVRLDFNDFREMQASREVRASFDAGFTMLHEILHGLGYKDAAKVDELGDCEELLNQARAELGLPQRDQYFGDRLQVARNIICVRLRFSSFAPRASPNPSRRRAQYLFFMVQSDSGSQVTPDGMAAFDCGKKR